MKDFVTMSNIHQSGKYERFCHNEQYTLKTHNQQFLGRNKKKTIRMDKNENKRLCNKIS